MENPAESFFGGLLIEVFIACIFFGITTLQCFIYSQKYPNDTTFLKYFVAVVWILETAHTAFCIQFVYAYLIENFGSFTNFALIEWGIRITIILEIILSAMVQAYYVRRVWILSKYNKFLTGCIALFLLAKVGFGLGSIILSYRFDGWIDFRDKTESLVVVSGALGAAALVDVSVALTISWYLMRERGDLQQGARSRINLIVMYIVNSGAITASASVLSVILYATQPRSLVFLGLVEIQGKLYANSFLGSLNAREHIRNKTNPLQYPSFEFNSNSGFRSPSVPKVEVFQQTIVTDDMGLHREGDLDNEYGMQNIKGNGLV